MGTRLFSFKSKSHSRSDMSGFTLIEIMVVILIIVGVLAIGGTRVFNPNENRRAQVRRFAIQAKEIRTAAKLQGSTYRLVIDMDDEKGHKFWVESAPGTALQLTEAQEEDLKKLTESQKQDTETGRAKFQKDAKFGAENKLNGGLVFEGVEVNGRKNEITKGLAYVHFFPQGLSDEAVIKIGDRKTLAWSIVIHPLTGAAEILQRKVTLKELRAQ